MHNVCLPLKWHLITFILMSRKSKLTIALLKIKVAVIRQQENIRNNQS